MSSAAAAIEVQRSDLRAYETSMPARLPISSHSKYHRIISIQATITTMEMHEALRLLQLFDVSIGTLTPELLRRQYLKLALSTHPDKNPGDPGAAERFASLGAAHAQLLRRLHRDRGLQREQEHTAALLGLLLRALRGEDVEEELQALGEYRPPSQFGVDLAVPFDARLPADEERQQQRRRPQQRHSEQHKAPPAAAAEAVDLKEAFREVFDQEGLTEEGDPVGGYELPLVREV